MKSYSSILAALLLSASTSGAATITLKKTTGSVADGALVSFSGTGGELTQSAGVGIIDSTDTIAANDNDITIPTSAAVKAYADGAISLLAGAGGGITYDAPPGTGNLAPTDDTLQELADAVDAPEPWHRRCPSRRLCPVHSANHALRKRHADY